MGMIPAITQPTRIMQSTANLIDNIFIGGKLKCNFYALLLLEDASDHLPTLVLLKQTKLRDKVPLIFKSRSLNERKLSQIHKDLKDKDLNGILHHGNCSDNFDSFCATIKESMDIITPVKQVQILEKRKYMEPWMNKG